jgi:hypothetical protein
MRIDWYPSHPHEKVADIAKQLYSHLPVKSQGASKSDREQKLFRACLQFISALYLNYHSDNKADSVNTYKSPKHFSSNKSDKSKSLTLIEPTSILEKMFDDIGFVWAKQPLNGN